ncbi:MAG TPA: hypothetical protein VL995_18045 [Cellvibrio sp.]|nr:hypothetical protein [Cellvibrio sp.]
MKACWTGVLFFLVSALLNLTVFFVSYKKLAFPFLHEEQRVDNAPQIFLYVVPSFLLVSLILAVLVYLVVKKKA